MQFADDDKEGRQPRRESIVINELDYEFVLAEIGFGKTQWVLLLMSGLLTLSSMATQTSVGIMAIASQCEFNMSQADKGVMMAACVAGIFVSTYFWGYVSDAFGRRTVLLYGMLITNLLQFITMFITNIWFFNIVNFFMGICLGSVSAAIYAYLSEFTTNKYRAVLINYSTMFVSIAAIYMPATCWWVLSAEWSLHISDGFVFRPWRLIILLNLLPGVIGALMLVPFPESPKLLLAQDKQSKAIEALEWICRFNTGRSVTSVLQSENYRLKPEAVTEDDVLNAGGACSILVSIWKATVPLFHKPHGRNFMLSAIAVFGMFLTSAGMQVWYPEIVNRSASAANNGSTLICDSLDASFEKQHLMGANMTLMDEVCDDTISSKTYIDNMIVGCAFLLGFTIQGALLNPLGRKNVLLIALGIGTLSGVLLHLVGNVDAVLVLFCLYILMPGLSISVMCGAVVDLVPTNLRGKAVSICLTMGRLGVIVASNLIGVMLEPLCNTTFGILTVSVLICAFLVYFLPI